MKVMTHVLLIFSIIGAMIISPNYTYAATNDSLPAVFNTTSNVYFVNDNTVLIQEGNELRLVDVVHNRAIKKLGVFGGVLGEIVDIQIIENKIIVLTNTYQNRVIKSVFNYAGEQINQFKYALTTPKDKDFRVKWVAPMGKTSERIMMEVENYFYLYEANGRNPIIVYDSATHAPKGYENVNVHDWDFRNYPYLAIEFTGQGIMREDTIVKVIDLYTKKSTDIDIDAYHYDLDLNINKQNRLEILTSYQYTDSLPPNAGRPDPSVKQPYYTQYSLTSGSKLIQSSSIFNQVYDEPSGWQTQQMGNHILVQDLEDHSWSIYSTTGKVVASKSFAIKPESKFLLYNTQTNTAYFLVPNTDGVSSSIVATKVDTTSL